MVAPIFKFRNVRLKLTTAEPTFIYGLVTYNSANPQGTLAQGVRADLDEVSTVVLTVQISNVATSGAAINVNVWLHKNQAVPTVLPLTEAVRLVRNYPLITANAFDPLSGNLLMTQYDQLWIQSAQANTCDVVVSLLEIANATAS